MLKSLLQFLPCAVNGLKKHLSPSQIKSLERGGGPSPSKQKQPTPKQIIGQQGEDAAAELVVRLGMRILARNWRKGRLELDIICQDGNTIVFVEVKTRKSSGMVAPHEALTLKKQRTLIRAGQAWLAANDAWHLPNRFDFIAVLYHGTHFTTEHTPHAFDLTSALGSSHTTWQP